jgi:perosamine synthetase
VIEDCAESHGATVRGRMSGSFGQMSCFSFYANKVITTGEGGMVLTNDDALARELRLLRNLAFGTPRFLHQKAGYNFRMTGMQAAMGVAQVGRIEEIIANKRRVAARYNAGLANIAEIQRPPEAEWARNVYWMYAVTVRADLDRDALTAFLLKEGIDTRTFFCPMNLQPFLRQQPGFRDVPCPVAEELWKTGFYLPSSTLLSDDQIDFICSTIGRFFHG